LIRIHAHQHRQPQNLRSGDGGGQLIEAAWPAKLRSVLTSTTPDTLTTYATQMLELAAAGSRFQPAELLERVALQLGFNRFGGGLRLFPRMPGGWHPVPAPWC